MMWNVLALLILAGVASAGGSYEEGDYMMRSSYKNPYPYYRQYSGSWAHREAHIWEDSMTLVFEVFLFNTLRGIVGFLIFIIIWTVLYWTFQGLQMCAAVCCPSTRSAAKWAAYLRLGFILISIIWLLFAFFAAATIATWDAAAIVSLIPISSLVFIAGLSGTMSNLYGGIAILYAGLIEPGVVISFQTDGMTVQGVIVSNGYQYAHVLWVVKVTDEDGKTIVHPVAPSGTTSAPRTEEGRKAETLIRSAVVDPTQKAILSRYDGSFGIEAEELESGNFVVWILAIPNSKFQSHVIAFPHAPNGTPVTHPVWSTRWSAVSIPANETSLHHVNSLEALDSVPASSANGRAIIEHHMDNRPPIHNPRAYGRRLRMRSRRKEV